MMIIKITRKDLHALTPHLAERGVDIVPDEKLTFSFYGAFRSDKRDYYLLFTLDYKNGTSSVVTSKLDEYPNVWMENMPLQVWVNLLSDNGELNNLPNQEKREKEVNFDIYDGFIYADTLDLVIQFDEFKGYTFYLREGLDRLKF